MDLPQSRSMLRRTKGSLKRDLRLGGEGVFPKQSVMPYWGGTKDENRWAVWDVCVGATSGCDDRGLRPLLHRSPAIAKASSRSLTTRRAR
jgi:hypothetical protein